jgi:aminoglycoside phosphotransferase (APT) family kinase protein
METAGGGPEVLQQQLERWAAAMYDESASIVGLCTLPGHAGLSFGFDVVHHGEVLDPLVLRMPPKGVRRSGNTDVLRQVPLLQALWARGVAVPETRWWDDDERWLGVPFTMVARLPGDTVDVRATVDRLGLAGARADLVKVFEQAIDAMAQIHLVPWGRMLPDWEEPKHLTDEVVFWDRLLDRSAEPEWVPIGRVLRDELLATAPADPVVGIFHGDYQTTNLLFDGGQLVAVLDWEISGIGAQLLDLGWLLMMNDPASWSDGDALVAVAPFADLVERYAGAIGRTVTMDDVAWYRALAGYRFGVISAFNVMLHRTGKRIDPEWDRIAPSVPLLFGRASELLRS